MESKKTITPKSDYYAAGKMWLTNSKINDFIFDSEYFYDKHIKQTIVEKPTDPMIIGSAVDCYLTEGPKAFDEKYLVVGRRSETSPWPYRDQLTEALHRKIKKMCDSCSDFDAYKDIVKGGFDSQVLLTQDRKVGLFDKIAGKPDWIKIEGDTCTIIDLKTANTSDPRKYYYHCEDFGYFRQAALYNSLAANRHPNISKFINLHLVLEKDNKELFRPVVFEIPKSALEKGRDELVINIEKISKLKTRKAFARPQQSLSEPQLLWTPDY